MKKQSYRQTLNELSLPKDTPKTLPCKMCGNPLRQIRVNRFTCFWVHKGADIQACAEKNNLFKAPVIANSQPYTGAKLTALWSRLNGNPTNSS